MFTTWEKVKKISIRINVKSENETISVSFVRFMKSLRDFSRQNSFIGRYMTESLESHTLFFSVGISNRLSVATPFVEKSTEKSGVS